MPQFINVHGFMHQMGTHLSQHQPSEMEEIATDLHMSLFHTIQKNHRSGWTKDNSYQEVNLQYEMCYMCFDCHCIWQNDNTSLCFQR